MNNTFDQLATYACQRGPTKREKCVCSPCAARREIFNSNIPVQLQEVRRMNLDSKLIRDLKDSALDLIKEGQQ